MELTVDNTNTTSNIDDLSVATPTSLMTSTTTSPSMSTSTSSHSNTLDIDPATFKSTLPPRKRAKTQEEKEQRKIERILRNRRAAHASREKKRKHVEYLENYVLKLEANLTKLNNNYNQAFELLTKDNQELLLSKLEVLDDVSDLKEQIHSNMSGTRRSHNKKSNDEDIEEEDEDEHQEEVHVEKQEIKKEEPVSKKRKLNTKTKSKTKTKSSNKTMTSTPPSSVSSLSPDVTNFSGTNTTMSSPIQIKKEFNIDNIFIKKEFSQSPLQPTHQPEQQEQQHEIYLKSESKDAFWNYPSPLSFHDSPLQIDIDTSSSSSTSPSSSSSLISSSGPTNHSIADLAAISLASRANRIISVGL